MTPPNDDDEVEALHTDSSSRPYYPGFLDWLIPAFLVLAGFAVVVGGAGLWAGTDVEIIQQMVAEGAIQSDMYTGQDLVDVTYATAWWSAIGLVVTGVAIWLGAAWFVVLRRRERRQEKTGEQPRYVWTNAIVGAVAAIVLGFIPLSQALGGAIAGYLQREDRDTNVKVGALSGLLTGLPIVIAVVFVFAGLIDGTLGVEDGNWAPLLIAVTGFTVVLTLLFVIAVGAIGGWIGGHLAGDSRKERTRARTSRQEE